MDTGRGPGAGGEGARGGAAMALTRTCWVFFVFCFVRGGALVRRGALVVRERGGGRLFLSAPPRRPADHRPAGQSRARSDGALIGETGARIECRGGLRQRGRPGPAIGGGSRADLFGGGGGVWPRTRPPAEPGRARARRRRRRLGRRSAAASAGAAAPSCCGPPPRRRSRRSMAAAPAVQDASRVGRPGEVGGRRGGQGGPARGACFHVSRGLARGPSPSLPLARPNAASNCTGRHRAVPGAHRDDSPCETGPRARPPEAPRAAAV